LSNSALENYTLALALIFGASTQAYAADSPEPADEIVVTANFRDSELMKSAGSLSVVTDQVILDRGSQHLEDTLNVLANVSFSSGASRARFIQIRGIGDLEQFVDPKYFPSVGLTIDDVDMNGLAGSAMLMDINQIELLRGPQGTRFGTNALAGMVNIRSNDPTENFSGYTEAGIGDHDSWNLGAAVGGPLTGKLLGRVAVRQYKSDGFISNDFLSRDNTNARDELGLRGKLRWLTDGNSYTDLTLSYVDIDNGYDAFSLDNSRHTLSDEPGRDQQESVSLALKGYWETGSATAVETVVAVTDSDSAYRYDEDWSNPQICAPGTCFPYANVDAQTRSRRNLSADIHYLSVAQEAFNWVGGLYAQRRDEDFDRQYYGNFSSRYKTDRYAAYGQLDYAWNERFTLTGGLRVEHFSDEYADTNSLNTDTDDDYWSGELTLQYFPNPNAMLYGTVSRGAKPGGTNTEASSTFFLMDPKFQSFIASRLRFGTETLLNKEIGAKGTWFDNALSLRFALFHMDRDDAQLESWLWDDVNFLWVGYLDSVNSAENYGAELEFDLRAGQIVSLFANVGWLETSVDDMTIIDLGPPGQNSSSSVNTINGRDQTKAPNWQYNLGTDLTLTRNLDARIELEGQSDSYFGYYHNQKIAAYSLLNASMGYRFNAITIRVWARNLTDKDYAVHGLYFGNDPRKNYVNESYHQYGEPRAAGVNVRFDF
jgi:iron complex outermembrane receptor protein